MTSWSPPSPSPSPYSSHSPSYVFDEGAPNEPCRPYSDNEWEKLVSSIIPPQPSSSSSLDSSSSRPVAIFISGLPGGGKSHSLQLIHATLSSQSQAQTTQSTIPPLAQFAIVDFDELRNFHQQYKSFRDRPNDTLPTTSKYRSYYDLVPWFIEGSDFEAVFFKSKYENRGLLPLIMRHRASFAMEAVLDNSGCFDFVQHVHKNGYRIVFVEVCTPVTKAIARAEARAYRTGRWSSPDFIRSRQAGLMEWFAPIARFVLHETIEGIVARYDNTLDNTPPKLLFLAPTNALLDSTETIFPDMGRENAMAEVERNTSLSDIVHVSTNRRMEAIVQHAISLVESCITSQAPSVPIGWGVDFCVAGGCFKTLVTGCKSHDVDVWPCSNEDRDRLLELFQNNASYKFIKQTNFNTQFENGQVVEIVTKCEPADLRGKLERFDIALSAVGVQFKLRCTHGGGRKQEEDGKEEGEWELKVMNTYVHSSWVASLSLRQPLLLIPMPNPSYMLATAERVIRYATEFGWSTPHVQLSYLRKQWLASENHDQLFKNYLETTRGGEAYQRVCDYFDINK